MITWRLMVRFSSAYSSSCVAWQLPACPFWTLINDHMFSSRVPQENQVCQECPEPTALLYVRLFLPFFVLCIKTEISLIQQPCISFLSSLSCLLRVTQERRGLLAPKETRWVSITHSITSGAFASIWLRSPTQHETPKMKHITFIIMLTRPSFFNLLKGPNGPQGAIGYPGPRGIKVSSVTCK